MNRSTLKKYARLIAKVGANVQPGQEVVIHAELDCPQFVELLTEACYRLGASGVRVEWKHQPLTPLHIKYRSDRDLARVEPWEVEKLRHRAEKLPARIILLSEDPDGLAKVDMEKYSRARMAQYPIIKPYRDAAENREQWCIAAVPGERWAKKMFPQDRRSGAVEKLWEAILHASRADGPDPEAAWEEHNRTLKEKCNRLNEIGVERLHYTAGNGTDFTVGFMENGLFLGGDEKTLGGVVFQPNIPSEEVFTTPKRGLAEGVVYVSKPYSYQGCLIEGIRLVFREGKVVECSADTNEELLRRMISMDEGASYLGECALVPYHSPISESGLLYYNTLFDENAACHIALGMGFVNCVRNFDSFTLEECRAMGVNDSMIHEDLMIGTPDMNITAYTRRGEEIPVFRNGDWAL